MPAWSRAFTEVTIGLAPRVEPAVRERPELPELDQPLDQRQRRSGLVGQLGES